MPLIECDKIDPNERNSDSELRGASMSVWIRKAAQAEAIAHEYGIQTYQQQSARTPGKANFSFATIGDDDACVFECGSSFYVVLSQGRWDSGTAQATLENQRTQSFMIFSGTKSNGSVSDLTLLSLPEIGTKFGLTAADLVIAAAGNPNYQAVLNHITEQMQKSFALNGLTLHPQS